MLKLTKNKKAQSTFEYLTVLILFLSIFFLFGYYLKRAIAGRWKTSSDMWGHERIYDGSDPVTGTGTIQCAYVDWNVNDGAPATIKAWYSVDLYREHDCARKCYGFTANAADCSSCITGCSIPKCNN